MITTMKTTKQPGGHSKQVRLRPRQYGENLSWQRGHSPTRATLAKLGEELHETVYTRNRDGLGRRVTLLCKYSVMEGRKGGVVDERRALFTIYINM